MTENAENAAFNHVLLRKLHGRKVGQFVKHMYVFVLHLMGKKYLIIYVKAFLS